MMKVLLDGRKMESRELTHEYLRKKMSFPIYYGGNLDALYDLLAGDDRLLNIVFVNIGSLDNNLGDYGRELLCTFLQAMQANGNIRIFLYRGLRKSRGKLFYKLDK